MYEKLKKLVGLNAEAKTDTVPRFESHGRINCIEKNGGRIEIHPSVILNSKQEGYHVGMPFEATLLADAPGALIQVGEGCRIHGAYIHAWDKVIIGRNVLIAAGTNIIDSNGHSANIRYARFRPNFKDQPKEIKIGDFAWLGMNSTILKGVEIGECAIVTAGSVVKESVPAFSIVEGNPARVVHVFSPDEALPEDYPQSLLSKEKYFFVY